MKRCDFCREQAVYLARFCYTQDSGKRKFYKYHLCEAHLAEQKASKNTPKDHLTSCAKITDLALCKRCGGTGHVPIPYAQGVCFLCNGTGRSGKVVTERKPEAGDTGIINT